MDNWLKEFKELKSLKKMFYLRYITKHWGINPEMEGMVANYT
jgi:hypothetical protein